MMMGTYYVLINVLRYNTRSTVIVMNRLRVKYAAVA